MLGGWLNWQILKIFMLGGLESRVSGQEPLIALRKFSIAKSFATSLLEKQLSATPLRFLRIGGEKARYMTSSLKVNNR
ncbi:hypothetical protein TNCV_4549391 [Trichonephila clavipes]|nr:hypothetical protein TNCV_4549391 [Trichonephila clavipes]